MFKYFPSTEVSYPSYNRWFGINTKIIVWRGENGEKCVSLSNYYTGKTIREIPPYLEHKPALYGFRVKSLLKTN